MPAQPKQAVDAYPYGTAVAEVLCLGEQMPANTCALTVHNIY
jgi:hypothetical protein